MTRIELIERLSTLHPHPSGELAQKVRALIEDIKEDGVLDVQAPADVAQAMGLMRDLDAHTQIELVIDHDGTKVWVNVDGRCALRVNGKGPRIVLLKDDRPILLELSQKRLRADLERIIGEATKGQMGGFTRKDIVGAILPRIEREMRTR